MVNAHCVTTAQTGDLFPGVGLLVVPQNVLSDFAIDSNYGVFLRSVPIVIVAQGDLGHQHQPQSLIHISLPVYKTVHQ